MKGIQGYLIFPCIGMVIINFMVLKSSLIALAVGLFFLFRIYFTKHKLVQAVTTIVVVFSFIFYLGFMKQHNHNIRDAKEQKETTLIFTIDPNTIKVNGESVQMEGRISGSKLRFPISYYVKSEQEHLFFKNRTAYLKVKATVELTEPIGRRNLGSFDYKEYLNQNQRYQKVKIKYIISLTPVSAGSVIEYLNVVRSRISHHIDKTLPKSIAMYTKSLFLGIKDQEFKQNQDSLSQLGILHFFSISGLHVFFFLNLVRYSALRLGLIRERVYWLEVLTLGCFFVLSGSATSVGRSVGYSVISVTNKRFRVGFSQLDCWAMTLMIFLVINPYILMQAGGIFSFSLTFYMSYLNPICAKYSNRMLREVSFSTYLTIFSIPTLSYFFYGWNLIAFGLTIMLAPFFSYILLPVLLVLLVLSYIGIPLLVLNGVALALDKLNELFLHLSQFRIGIITTGAIPLFIYLLTFVFILYWLAQSNSTRLRSFLVLGLIVALPSVSKYVNPVGQIAFVDVGQGASLVVDLPFKQGTFLVDTGGEGPRTTYSKDDWRYYSDKKSQASYGLLPYLKSRGVTRIDQVFITHGHADHYGDLLEISHNLPVNEVRFPKGAVNQPGFSKVVQNLIQHHVTVKNMMRGSRLDFKGVTLRSLYPKGIGDGGNNDSLVLSMTLKDKRFLLMGDLEEAGEIELLREGDGLKSDVLSVGHHGSKTSSSPAFLKQVQPKIAVISCGVNNKFGHPNQETLTNLNESQSTIFRTDQQGMIYFNWVAGQKKLSPIHTVIKAIGLGKTER